MGVSPHLHVYVDLFTARVQNVCYVFETHRLTHSLTDGQTRMQYAFGAVFKRWWMHKNTSACTRYLTHESLPLIAASFVCGTAGTRAAQVSTFIFTVRLHVMKRGVANLSVRLSVCLTDACIMTKLNDALCIF